MSPRSALGLYAVAAVGFLALDLVWLTPVAPALFYAIFVAGLVYFVIAPAVVEGSVRTALVRGAAFGFVTYATWDLTSLAVIEGFPVGIVPIDLAWGTFLAAAVSATTYLVWRRL